MDIGGIDINFPRPVRAPALAMLVRMTQTRWPSAVFENANDDGSAVDVDVVVADGPSSLSREFFIFKSSAARRVWDEYGAVDEARDTMVHVIVGDDGVDFVVDDGETQKLVNEVIEAWNNNPQFW